MTIRSDDADEVLVRPDAHAHDAGVPSASTVELVGRSSELERLASAAP